MLDYWSEIAISFSSYLPNTDQIWVSCIAGRHFRSYRATGVLGNHGYNCFQWVLWILLEITIAEGSFRSPETAYGWFQRWEECSLKSAVGLSPGASIFLSSSSPSPHACPVRNPCQLSPNHRQDLLTAATILSGWLQELLTDIKFLAWPPQVNSQYTPSRNLQNVRSCHSMSKCPQQLPAPWGRMSQCCQCPQALLRQLWPLLCTVAGPQPIPPLGSEGTQRGTHPGSPTFPLGEGCRCSLLHFSWAPYLLQGSPHPAFLGHPPTQPSLSFSAL